MPDRLTDQQMNTLRQIATALKAGGYDSLSSALDFIVGDLARFAVQPRQTGLTDQIAQLVARWRKESEEWSSGESYMLGRCADELAALLATHQEPETVTVVRTPEEFAEAVAARLRHTGAL